jgi:hypothetical protein
MNSCTEHPHKRPETNARPIRIVINQALRIGAGDRFGAATWGGLTLRWYGGPT